MIKNLNQSLSFWLIPLLLIALWYFKEIIFIFGTGIVLGLSIQSLANYSQSKLKLNFYLNILVIYLLLIILISLFFFLTFRVIISEIPDLLEKIKVNFPLVKASFKKFELTEWLMQNFSLEYLTNLTKIVSIISSALFEVVVIFIISLYTALARNFTNNFVNFLFFLPDSKKEEIYKFLKITQIKIAFWFLGQLFLMFFIGLATYIFMGLVLKIQYSVLVGLVAGLFEIVPVIGPAFTLIFAVLITLIDKPNYLLLVIGYFILLQQIENYLVVPLVMKKAINVNPLLIILGILMGGKLGGILGIILVLPVLGVGVEVYKYLAHKYKS